MSLGLGLCLVGRKGGEASGTAYQVIRLNTPMALATLEWAGTLAYTRTRKHSKEAPTNTMMQHTHGHRMVKECPVIIRSAAPTRADFWRIWYDSVGTGRVFGRQHGQDTGGSGRKPARTECFRQAALDVGLSDKDVRLAIASLLLFLFLFLCLLFFSFLIFITPSRTITRDLCKIPTKSFCFIYSHIKCIMFRQLVRL